MIRRRFFLIVCAILLISFVIILGYRGNKVKISPAYKISTMHDLHMTHKESSKIKWELTADKALFPLGNKEIFLTSPELKINHTPEIILTSGKGVYEVEKGDIFLNNLVEIRMEDKKFVTDTLIWNSSEELMTTDENVRFIGKNFLIEGTGLTAKINQEKLRILKNVKAVFYR